VEPLSVVALVVAAGVALFQWRVTRDLAAIRTVLEELERKVEGP
jgi:low affinity Fe/Cu permease